MDGKYFDESTLISQAEVRVVYFGVSYLFGKKSDGL